MFGTFAEFSQAAQPLIRAFEDFVNERKIEKSEAQADHLCYKCSSSEEFEAMKQLFDFESEFLYQSIISERRIAYIKLKIPFETPLGDIVYLELSDQKKDGSQKSGFDHIEIYPKLLTYEAFAQDLGGRGVAMKKVIRPHHTTYDIELNGGFLLRLEPEVLIDKIKREEMK